MGTGEPVSAYERNRTQRATTAERLTALMQAQGVSVGTLADSVRIQRSTLANFCAGGPSIPFDVMERIAKQLNTTAGYLSAASDDPRPPKVS
jgi:transcriptional regulator with XRE-family HTH domain